jgi:sialic acid synthase SpsE/spore coat polysaccharide biosynthesis protein SpsF (cytidylyltransferase family)
MKVGIILLCRHNSRRLPGKILKTIHGRTVLNYITQRIERAVPLLPLVIATSRDQSDDCIDAFCRHAQLPCFRGELEDVSKRFIECAELHRFDFATRINGDNIFVDIESLQSMLAIANTNHFDFISNVPGRTFPYGMSIEIVRTDFYREQFSKFSSEADKEHVTSWLYEHPDVGKRYVFVNRICPQAAGLQLALDTAEDLQNLTTIIKDAGPTIDRIGLSALYKLASPSPLSFPWSGPVGPLLIAEIGGNHEGNFAVAKQLCELAIGARADCIKFQLYTGNGLVSAAESPDRNRHFKKFELSREQHIYLAEMCQDAGAIYNASVWNLDMLDWIDGYLSFYKIGSGDLTAWPLIREFAIRRKPILLSTGLATMDEVLHTVRFIQSIDSAYRKKEMLCLLQCTSMYPISDQEANLRVMDSFREITDLSVGYSDHTEGMAALKTAAAMGANVLEFHFTESRDGQSFRDHKVSLTADELAELRSEILQITSLRGAFSKHPQESELENNHHVSFRRAVYLNKSLPAGSTITKNDLVYLRPAHGTDARDADCVVGAKALKNLQPFVALVPDYDYA